MASYYLFTSSFRLLRKLFYNWAAFVSYDPYWFLPGQQASLEKLFFYSLTVLVKNVPFSNLRKL